MTGRPTDEDLPAPGAGEEAGSQESQVSAFVTDRGAAEALSLEVRRLARSLGLELGQIRVERAEDEPEDASA
ncbi:MAG TPA: hypothetical protein VIA61_06075 [Methylomirabilota bacterium]